MEKKNANFEKSIKIGSIIIIEKLSTLETKYIRRWIQSRIWIF
jgi:hypothetical protein